MPNLPTKNDLNRAARGDWSRIVRLRRRVDYEVAPAVSAVVTCPAGEPLEIARLWPYYSIVPKGRDLNLEYRDYVLNRGTTDAEFRETLRIICQRDLLFWINVMCFIHEPRPDVEGEGDEGAKVRPVPFVTWDFQDDALTRINAAVGVHDLWTDKSRDMGATWMVLTDFIWRAVTKIGESYMIASRNAAMVDSASPNSLFYKVDYLIERLPGWLLPSVGMKRTSMALEFKLTSSVIVGETTTGAMGQGGRQTGMLMDEATKFTSVRDVCDALDATVDQCNSRFVVFTQDDEGSPAALQAAEQRLSHPERVLELDYTLHPEKRRGLYKVFPDGRTECVDTDYVWPPDYKFNNRFGREMVERAVASRGGFVYRSAWFDGRVSRSRAFDDVLKNVLRTPVRFSSRLIEPATVEEFVRHMRRTPCAVGNLEYDDFAGVPKEFVATSDGKLTLWLHLAVAGRPPEGQYAISCDVSAGAGSSDSVAAVFDLATREQVAEFADKWLKPHEFAGVVAALGRWFHDAEIIWEHQGPGAMFASSLQGTYEYRKLYYGASKPGGKRNDAPGIVVGRQVSRKKLLGTFIEALSRSELTVRSEAALRELLAYRYAPGDKVVHQATLVSRDPAADSHNHGDRAMACALMAWLMRTRNLHKHGNLTKTRVETMEQRMKRREDVRAERGFLRVQATERRADLLRLTAGFR